MIDDLFVQFEGAFAENTIKAYRADFSRFSRWSCEEGIDPLDARPEVLIDVQTPDQIGQQFVDVWTCGKQKRNARISFTSPELLWKVLTAKRWDILKAMCGVGPVSIREASRRVERDVKAVHRDVTALLAAGLLQKNEQGLVEFPYEAVKVEFLLEAA